VTETTILLARHGETEWNLHNRFQGHADEPLNDTGREQARALAAALAVERLDAVYTSPLLRALETAEIVAASFGLAASADPRLMEVDVGSWSGLTREEIAATFPDAYRRWQRGLHGWEGGETYEQLAIRVLAALRDIAGAHPAETVLVVGHGGTVRATLAHTDGMDVVAHRKVVGPAANCAVYRLGVRDGAFRRVD
jgi:broad specificity phosphatase PhoE